MQERVERGFRWLNLAALLSAAMLLSSSVDLKAQSPADYRINVLKYGPPGGRVIETAILKSKGNQYTHFYLPQGTYAITNSITFPVNSTVELAPNALLVVYANKTLAFQGNDLIAHSEPHFYGSGTATGTVNGLWGCWDAWDAMTGNYLLECVGINPETDYWETTNQVGGDLEGTLENLQIKTGVVTTVEILDYTVETNDLSTNVWNRVGDIAEYWHTTTNRVFFQVGTAGSGTTVLAPGTGWITTNVPMTEVAWNVKSAWSTNLNCFVAPHDGSYEFKQMFLYTFDPPWGASEYCRVLVGSVVDNPPLGNIASGIDMVTSTSAEDFYFSGSSANLDDTAGGALFPQLAIDFSWTFPVAAGSRVYPAFFFVGTMPFTNDLSNGWWVFQGQEVTKGGLP